MDIALYLKNIIYLRIIRECAHLESYKLRNSMKQKPKICIMFDSDIEIG